MLVPSAYGTPHGHEEGMALDVEWQEFQLSAVLHGCYVMPNICYPN